MKTLVLSMISIAATVAAMTACTSESDPIDEINPQDAKVEIKATAGIGSIEAQTKAAINQGDALTGVTFARIDGETPEWDNLNAASITGNIAESTGAISFTPAQYYPQTGKTSLIGYYPTGTPTSGIVSYTGLNGTQDIMCSNIVEAARADVKTVNFALAHKLTQLKFKVKANDAEAISNWGTITSIELINQKTSAKLTLKTGNLAFEGEAKNPISIISGATQALKTTSEGEDIGSSILVEPGQTYTVNVITSTKTEVTPITLKDVAGTASTAYTVLLTFKGKNIDSTGSIGEWTPNTSGTGEAE